VTTDNCDVLIRRIGPLYLRDEAGGTDNIERGHTKQALGIVDTLGLEDFGGNRDGGVDLRVNQYGASTQKLGYRTGFEMTRMLASGAASAVAFARSRTMEALVLKRSANYQPCA
jgi:hypothetical protein